MVQIAGSTHKGKIRTRNEDNYYCYGKIRVSEQEDFSFSGEEKELFPLAVFDGMGGLEAGDQASYLASGVFADLLSVDRNPEDSFFEKSILKMNHAVAAESIRTGREMGSTCVLLQEREGCFRSWNVGDSRSYLYRNENLIQMSEDHTEARRMQKLSQKLGMECTISVRAQHTLTQYLGMQEDEMIPDPTLSEWVTAEEGDVFLLCSDGLTDMVKDEKIAAILSRTEGLTEKRNQLEQCALDAGGRDNITILLAEIC